MTKAHPTHITPLLLWEMMFGPEKLSEEQKQELLNFKKSWGHK